MNRQQKKEKLKHKKEVQKLKEKYVTKGLMTLCKHCKYRLDNCITKQLNDDRVHCCNRGTVDLNIIREHLKIKRA